MPLTRRPVAAAPPDVDDYRSTVSEDTASEEEAVFEEEDEDERPKRSSTIQRGWAAAKKMAEATTNFTNEFKFPDDGESLVKILDDEPFAVYAQHWLDERGKGKKKSFVCPESIDQGDCPLCSKLGDSPAAKFAFSVLTLDDEPEVQMLVAGPRLLGVLAKWNEDPKVGPLTRGYWALSRSGSGSGTSYTVRPIKERDLDDDFGLDIAEVQACVNDAVPLKADEVYVNPTSELLEIARELSRN